MSVGMRTDPYVRVRGWDCKLSDARYDVRICNGSAASVPIAEVLAAANAAETRKAVARVAQPLELSDSPVWRPFHSRPGRRRTRPFSGAGARPHVRVPDTSHSSRPTPCRGSSPPDGSAAPDTHPSG